MTGGNRTRPGRGWRARGAGRPLAAAIILILCMALPPIPSAAADPGKSTPRSVEQIRLSFAPLVRQAGPAVVNIYAKTVVTERRGSTLFDDPFFRRFFGDMVPSKPRQRTQQSLGSGVLVDPDGIIVTNHHVIENAQEIKVVLSDRREYDAKVLTDDERTDLAVLKIDAGTVRLPFLEFHDSDELEVGDLVLAIGNPFGVGQTVTSGIVSGLARTSVGITDYSFFIQTDAAINPGNSGGALVTMDGRLVGVNTAIFSNQRGGTGGSIGIGFAVPSNMVRTVLTAARGGRVVRPWVGIGGQPITAELAREFGLDLPVGVVVTQLYPKGPAERAGMEVGDIVLEVAGKPVDDQQSLRYRIATRPIGETVAMTLLRKGRRLTVGLPLREAPAEPAADETEIRGQNPFEGAVVANLSPAYALERDLDDMERGVVIAKVRRGSVAANLGLRPGDVVLAVNGSRIDRVAALRDAVKREQALWRLSIRRDGKVLNSEIRG